MTISFKLKVMGFRLEWFTEEVYNRDLEPGNSYTFNLKPEVRFCLLHWTNYG